MRVPRSAGAYARVRFWKMAPATPSAAPKTRPASTRGNRQSEITTERSAPVRTANTSPGEAHDAP